MTNETTNWENIAEKEIKKESPKVHKNNFLKFVRWTDLLFLAVEVILFMVLMIYHQWFSIVSFLPLIPLLLWLNITNWFFIGKKTKLNNFNFQMLKSNSIRKYSIIMSYLGLLIPSIFAIWFNKQEIIFFFPSWKVQFGNMILFAVISLIVFASQHILYIVELVLTNKEINKKDIELSEYHQGKLKAINKSLFIITLLYIAIYLVVVIIFLARYIKKKRV